MIEILKIIVFFPVVFFIYKWLKSQSASLSLYVVCLFLLSRFLFSAFHEYTYVPVLAGMSLNSIHSFFFTFLIFLVLPKVFFFDKNNYLFYMLIVLMVFSAVLNDVLARSLVSITKWILMVEFILLLGYVYFQNGIKLSLATIGASFSYPVFMLLISVILGETKYNDIDGTNSYIGGFFHEGVFSIVIYTAFVLHFIMARSSGRFVFSYFAIFVYLILLFFVGYRTTILAFVSTLMLIFLNDFIVSQSSRRFVFIITLIVLPLSFLVDFSKPLERFQEIPNAAVAAKDLWGSPHLFDKEERRFLSGRLYIWSHYVEEANSASILQKLFGHGMDSWKKMFNKYAHNTFVSFYYELGIVGVFLLSFLFFRFLVYSMSPYLFSLRGVVIGSTLAYILLNLATMPLWQIEGVFLFSLLYSLVRFLGGNNEKKYQ